MRRLAVVIAALAAPVTLAGSASAAEVANPGPVKLTMGSQDAFVKVTTPDGPVTIDLSTLSPAPTLTGTVTQNGTVTVPQGQVQIPAASLTVDVFNVTATLAATDDWVGTVDPVTGSATLNGHLKVTLVIDGLFPITCVIGATSPVALEGTTTGAPYNPATGALAFTDDSVTVPAVAVPGGCTSGGPGADFVAGVINSELGLPAAASVRFPFTFADGGGFNRPKAPTVTPPVDLPTNPPVDTNPTAPTVPNVPQLPITPQQPVATCTFAKVPSCAKLALTGTRSASSVAAKLTAGEPRLGGAVLTLASGGSLAFPTGALGKNVGKFALLGPNGASVLSGPLKLPRAASSKAVVASFKGMTITLDRSKRTLTFAGLPDGVTGLTAALNGGRGGVLVVPKKCAPLKWTAGLTDRSGGRASTSQKPVACPKKKGSK